MHWMLALIGLCYLCLAPCDLVLLREGQEKKKRKVELDESSQDVVETVVHLSFELLHVELLHVVVAWLVSGCSQSPR